MEQFSARHPQGQFASGDGRFYILKLKKRADFVAASKAFKEFRKTIIVQGRPRNDGDCAVRIGFTCTKKLGNAVVRNRAKRRMREIARAHIGDLARPGWDYVLIGKVNQTAIAPFEKIVGDFRSALHALGEH